MSSGIARIITSSDLKGPHTKFGNKFELAKNPRGIEKIIPIIVPTQAIHIVSSSLIKTLVIISVLKSGGIIKLNIFATLGNELTNLSHVIERSDEDQNTTTPSKI